MPKTEEDKTLRVNVLEEGARARSEWITCDIGENLQFSPEPLASYFFAEWEPIIFDALLVAAAVEFCDKVKRRSVLHWAREIELRVPVHDPQIWARNDVSQNLHEALEFLTGDRWQIEFSKRRKSVARPQQGLFNLPSTEELAVIPFSEGLDSRAVAGLLTKELGTRLIRVRLGTKADDRPQDASGRSAPFAAVPYKVKSGDHRFPESTARSRGFKFALLSGLAAYLAKAERVFVPESGQGALGPALVPVGQVYEDYRNHPLFTEKMSAFLKALLGCNLRFEFPRLWYTKGQTLREYVSADPQPVDWATTRSCWQDNRQVSVNGHRRQCGVCAACMLRRLSVYAAGLSEAPETYVWEDLRARSFAAGAAEGFDKIAAQRDYAIAGVLHLDHVASLRRSPINAPALDGCAQQLARSLGRSTSEVRSSLDGLLAQHEKEWIAFMQSLGPNSFVLNWTERAHDHAA
jgi:7-cyano-7-deazaguanine synthase in queuosine biosynthesis